MSEDQAMKAVEEVLAESGSGLSIEIFRRILEVEQQYAFDAQPDLALKEIEQIIDAFLRAGGVQ